MMKIYRYGQTPLKDFFIRTVEKSGVADTVRSIIADVEQRGDEALFEYTRRFDGADLRALEVSREEIDAAYERTDPEFLRVLEQAAETVPVFQSFNMSIGVALLARLVKQAAAVFGGADVEIIEAHHNRKADAPSGTALMLADAVKSQRPESQYVFGRSGQHKRQPNEIGIHAIRMGNVVGEHEVIFGTDSQTITP